MANCKSGSIVSPSPSWSRDDDDEVDDDDVDDDDVDDRGCKR